MIQSKMADDVILQIKNVLHSIVSTTDRSGNRKKELRHEIHETVRKLRKLVYTLKSELLENKEENHKMCLEVKQLKDALEKEKSSTSARQVVISADSNEIVASCGSVTSAAPPAEG